MSDGSEDLVPGSDPIGQSDDSEDLVAESDPIEQSDDDDSYYNHVSDSDPSQYLTDNDRSSEEEEVSDRPANSNYNNVDNNFGFRPPNSLTRRPISEPTEILVTIRVPIDLVEEIEYHMTMLRAHRDWARRFDRLEEGLAVVRQMNEDRTLKDIEE